MKRNLAKFEKKEQEKIRRRVYQIEQERNWNENRKAMMDVQFRQMLEKDEQENRMNEIEREQNLNENQKVITFRR